jgi:hypothetical protein
VFHDDPKAISCDKPPPLSTLLSQDAFQFTRPSSWLLQPSSIRLSLDDQQNLLPDVTTLLEFLNHPALKELVCYDVPPCMQAAEGPSIPLARLTNLTHLSAPMQREAGPPGPVCWSTVGGLLTSLESITLLYPYKGEAPAYRAFEPPPSWEALTRLTRLAVENDMFCDAPVDLQLLSGMTSLRSLKVGDCSGRLSDLAGMLHLTSLEVVTSPGASLGPPPRSLCKSLKRLIAPSAPPSDMRHFRHLAVLSSLEVRTGRLGQPWDMSHLTLLLHLHALQRLQVDVAALNPQLCWYEIPRCLQPCGMLLL